MSSVEFLREFVTERLTAAAEEILGVFVKTMVEYQEEIERQRRLLDVVWKPEIKLHRIELQQQSVCKEEEVLTDQQLCKQERNSSLDREEPESPQIKEEQEEVCSSQEGEQRGLKQETNTFLQTPTTTYCNNDVDNSPKSEVIEKEIGCQRRLRDIVWKPKIKLDKLELPHQHGCKKEEVLTDHKRNSSMDQEDPEPPQIKEEQEELYTSRGGEQLVLNQETDTFMLIPPYEESDPSEPAPSSDQEGSKHVDSGSTRNAESKPKKTYRSNNADNSPMSETHCDTQTGSILLKVKLGDVQKFVRVSEPSLKEFLMAAFAKFDVPAVTEGVKVVDSSGTELDDDVFEEIVTDPSAGVLTIKYDAAATEVSSEWLSSPHSPDSQDTVVISDSPSRKLRKLDAEAKQLVESILTSKPGGERIINEYNRTKSLVDETRRKLVNILAADMTEKNGTSPPRQVKEMYARGIVTLFPYLSDPYSKNGYEHYYDGESGTGYLAWRIKTIQRCTAKDRRSSFGAPSGRPTVRRGLQFVAEKVLSEDECKETISLMKHSTDEDTVKKKMRLTFLNRRNMVLDPLHSNNTLSDFPRFKDIKGLIEQDFVQMFGEDVSGRFLERWPTTFKRKIIQQCRKLPSTSDLEELLLAADPSGDTKDDADIGWDSDLSTILLLLHLIPPSAQGRKKPGKVSATQAEKHLVVFKRTGTNLQEHLDAITTSTQPYLLAVGANKNKIHQFFVILDKNAIPCKSTSSLGAFDELFKAHFVFGTSYNTMLHNMYTFIQTTVYNIGVGKVKESPRVAEVRAKLLH